MKTKDIVPPERVFKCDKCNVRVKNNEKLRMHNQVYHSHNKGTQSKENGVFEEFNCFYFDEKIISGDKLEDHTTDCQSVFDSPINLPSMYLEQWPCDICEAKFNDMLDLERHKRSYHQQDMKYPYNPYYDEEDLMYCDLRGMEFRTLVA